MDAITHARTGRLVSFGAFCQKITQYEGRVPKRVIGGLRDYRISLTAMKEDPVLSEIAVNRLNVLELLLQYAEAYNAGDTQKAKVFNEKAQAEHDVGDRMIEEVLDRGI